RARTRYDDDDGVAGSCRRELAGEPTAVLLVDGERERDAGKPRLRGRRGGGMMRIGAPQDDRFALAGPGAAQVGDRGLSRGGHRDERGKYGDPGKLRHDWPPLGDGRR